MKKQTTSNDQGNKTWSGVSVEALLEAVGLKRLVPLVKDLEREGPRWGLRTVVALCAFVVVSVALLTLLTTVREFLSSDEMLLPFSFSCALLPTFTVLHLLWKPWPRRRLRLYMLPLAILWLTVTGWLLLAMIGVGIRTPTAEGIHWILGGLTPTPWSTEEPEMLWTLFDDEEGVGTWEFCSIPAGALPVGVVESHELQDEDCYEGTACIMLGDPSEKGVGPEETVPVADVWATWRTPSSGLPSCSGGRRLHLVFWWRMVTYDVLKDYDNEIVDYFEVVTVREDGAMDSTDFGREGNPRPGTAGRRHDMDWYVAGEYQRAKIDLTHAPDTVAVRFITANKDYAGNPTYDLYSTYTLLDTIYLTCARR